MVGHPMSATPGRTEAQAAVSAERVRAFVLPIAAAVLLFAALVYLQFDLYLVFPGPGQFSAMLGKSGFIIQFPLGVGFYFCYAWHNSLVQKANVHAEKLKKG